jgi:hypothetical protein
MVKKLGIALSVIGFILMAVMIYGFIAPNQLDRGNDYGWVNNWAPILGLFIFTAGVALWYASTKGFGKKDDQTRV